MENLNERRLILLWSSAWPALILPSIHIHLAAFLPLWISLPPIYLPSSLPSFLPSFHPSPPQLDVFTSQILISKTSAEALAVAPSRQLCSSQPPLSLSLSLSLRCSTLVFCSAWWGHVRTIPLWDFVWYKPKQRGAKPLFTHELEMVGGMFPHIARGTHVCKGATACVRVAGCTREPRSLACCSHDGNDNGNVITLSLDSLLKTRLCHEKGIPNKLRKP